MSGLVSSNPHYSRVTVDEEQKKGEEGKQNIYVQLVKEVKKTQITKENYPHR